jgi:hypothetical protein
MKFWELKAAGNEVSIHAPTRGATSERDRYLRLHRCFNPRAHARRDTLLPNNILSANGFQSTRGATPKVGGIEDAVIVSIHAPTRGATVG